MERNAFSYRFGTAEFDEARFELRVAGLPVEVERRALEVLAYLLRHAGEVVTKDELLREVWAGRVTVDKVLPNAVNKLRRALGEANAGHISTQARLGYRLDGPVHRTAVGRQLASELEFVAGQPVAGRENFILQRQLGRTAGSERSGTPNSSSSSGDHSPASVSNNSVREALEGSVTCSPHSLNSSHESIVPNTARPSRARCSSPSTLPSSHSILVAEKYGSSTSPVRWRTRSSSPASRSSAQSGAVRRSCQTIALWIGSPDTLSQMTTVSR